MRTLSIGGALVAVAVALVMGLGGVAVAQEVRTDPNAGSPAGVIYQIPLDSGRRDAAPVLPVGSRHGGPAHTGGAGTGSGPGAGVGGGGGSTGGSGAVGRSAAGGTGLGGSGSSTGSGAAGSGAASTGAAQSAGGGEGASTAGGTPSDPSSIHSENGFGSSSQVPGVSPAAARIGAGVAAAHTAGSTLPGYLLMALIALAAIAVGLVAHLARVEPK
jgi:hypothetical protein